MAGALSRTGCGSANRPARGWLDSGGVLVVVSLVIV
jgi:hypothetical protein